MWRARKPPFELCVPTHPVFELPRCDIVGGSHRIGGDEYHRDRVCSVCSCVPHPMLEVWCGSYDATVVNAYIVVYERFSFTSLEKMWQSIDKVNLLRLLDICKVDV